MKWGNGKKSLYLFIQGHYWLDWLFGPRKRACRPQSQKLCRMIAGLLLAVMLALGSFVLSPLPVARADTTYTMTGGAYYVSIVNNVLYFATVPVTGIYQMDNSISLDNSGYTKAGTFSFVINGVEKVNNASLAWESGARDTHFGGKIATSNLPGYGDASVDTWSFTFSGTLTSNMTHYAVTINGGGSAVLNSAYSGLFIPVSVSITGPLQTGTSSSATFEAIAVDGSAPYRYLWAIDWVTDLSTTEVYTGSLGTVASLEYRFTFVGHFRIRVTCLDSKDAEATAGWDVNLGEDRPVLHGQLLDYGSAGENPDDAIMAFYLFDDKPHGVAPWPGAEAIPTSDYSVNSPQTGTRMDQWYAISVPFAALPDPLVVVVSYTDPVTRLQWLYSFSFPTTGWAHGNWIDTEGQSGSRVETPGWLTPIETMLRAAFRWLFVPSDADMARVFPSGAVSGESFNPFGGLSSGAARWTYKVTWQGKQLTLMDLNLDLVPSGTWTLCRVIVGAVVAGAEIMLLITLL